MIAINAQILQDIYENDKVNIDNLIIAKKAILLDFINNPTKIVKRIPVLIPISNSQRDYLTNLYDHFEDVVLAKPNEIENLKIDFNNIISQKDMKLTAYKDFRNELINRLGYKDLRNNFYHTFFEKTGIKACVYCNAQLAVTVRKVNGEKSAKFQVDHFYPKSEYPCFSISIYNLYPVCGPCNNSKSSNAVHFNLYSFDYNDYKSSKFTFELEKKSILKYRVNGVNSELEILFNEQAGTVFNSVFDVKGIYETQKDIAEELVLKSMIYNKAYTDSLKNGLEKLYKDKAPMLERLLIGNYIDEKEIHKRPMAKFVQDIAKQLKLI